MSLADFKALAKKYSVSSSGSRTTLAETISNLRGSYLTKAEIEMIQPYLKKQTKNKIASHFISTRQFQKGQNVVKWPNDFTARYYYWNAFDECKR